MAEYDLDSLGWYQFERLCQSLLKAQCGLAVEAWGRSGDMGRDAYSESPLRFPGKDETPGPFIFQAKFVSGANAAGADPLPGVKAGVRSELARIAKREDSGQWERPSHYALLTNAPLSGDGRKEIRAMLEAGMPDSTILVQEAADLDAMLDDSPRVRLAYPQVLGVRDLFALLDQRVNKDILTRSSLGMEAGREEAKTFVATDAYTKTLSVLNSHYFVVLTGPPEMGKTTIARMVALARLTGEWEAFECRIPEDLFKVLDPESPQIFVVDDAFGSTEYQPDLGQLWAEDLDKVIRALDYRHWLLLTSRSAPLKTALQSLHLQGKAEDFPDPQRVLVNASALSVQEKAQMLYRHAKSAVESLEGRDLIRKNARAAIDHEHFTPLRIHRFVTKQLPAILESPEEQRDELMSAAVTANLEAPTKAMTVSFAQLPEDCKVLLISMLDAGGQLLPMERLTASFERHLGHAPERSAESVAEAIDTHFVRLVDYAHPSGGALRYAQWVHPSVRDLVIDHLMNDAASRQTFLGRAGIDGVMLALSSEGGATGERLFPLLQSEGDWRLVKERVTYLAESGESLTTNRLSALLADTARLLASEEAAVHRTDLAELTKLGLDALREHWPRGGDPFAVGSLRNFYRASIALLPPSPGPDVSAVWTGLMEAVSAMQDADIVDFVNAAENWIDFATLLQENEPRWLIGLGFHQSKTPTFEVIVDRLEVEKEQLASPSIEDHADRSEYAEPPPDLDWVVTSEDILLRIAEFAPEFESRCEALTAVLPEKAAEWEEYGEEHHAYIDPKPEEDYDERFGEETEVFDIEVFFSDL